METWIKYLCINTTWKCKVYIMCNIVRKLCWKNMKIELLRRYWSCLDWPEQNVPITSKFAVIVEWTSRLLVSDQGNAYCTVSWNKYVSICMQNTCLCFDGISSNLDVFFLLCNIQRIEIQGDRESGVFQMWSGAI